jgi:hypothetical protein
MSDNAGCVWIVGLFIGLPLFAAAAVRITELITTRGCP